MNEVLTVRDLRHRYGGTVALDGVDLTVRPGECVALLGPNGAGKTTLVSLVTGLLARQTGQISLAGGDPRDARTRRGLGAVQQSIGFPNTLKVGELVAGAAVRRGASRGAAGPVLAELDLTSLANRRAAKLSGGQQQRVQLGMALVGDPALLVLDEPTVGLDVPSRRRFWEILAERRFRGAGVLVTTHLIEECSEVADRVVVVSKGKVLADERPDRLIDRITVRSVVATTTLADDRLAALPGVLSVNRDGDEVHLGTRNCEQVLRALLAEDPAVGGLRVEGARLEDAVVHLTEGSLV
ncbi:ABC transporter ATP-binding protein [Kutzneria sp. NPDC052558]|uniref:ABC transporter ATP-binding protein n=1 Tax=Kutzneria sp. NPDC052558 TaxID=3364121 RepID=UPI0037CB9A43